MTNFKEIREIQKYNQKLRNIFGKDIKTKIKIKYDDTYNLPYYINTSRIDNHYFNTIEEAYEDCLLSCKLNQLYFNEDNSIYDSSYMFCFFTIIYFIVCLIAVFS